MSLSGSAPNSSLMQGMVALSVKWATRTSPERGMLAYATDDVAARPRLLLITYHFPPDPAIGSLRWQKFVRHAVARGWGVDVIMRDPSELAIADPERTADLPRGVRVYGVRSRTSWLDRLENELARITRGIRTRTRKDTSAHTGIGSTANNGDGNGAGNGTGNGTRPPRESSRARSEIGWPRGPRDITRAYFAVAEYMRGQRWVTDAVNMGAAIVQRGVHRVVISSGPPHFAHDVARRVARGAGLPFVMDLRDAWSQLQRLPEDTSSPVLLAITSACERRAIANAGLVVANTEPLRNLLRQTYPRAATRIIAVPNGYDEEEAPPPQDRSAPFMIAYAGTIYLDRDPGPLFRGAARAIATLGLTPADLSIQFMGNVHEFNGTSVAQLARDAGIGDFVQLHPPRSRSEALDFLASASMLVQLPQDTDMAIPAKLFEYMRYNAWVFVLADPGSATELLLQGTDVDIVAPGDPEAIGDVIVRRFKEYAGGGRGKCLSAHERFSRKAHATTFFEAVERLAGSPAGEHSSL
jgi:glycosyltransferase involved in cell wall biosynthesis